MSWRKRSDRKIGILPETEKETVPFQTDLTEENEVNDEDRESLRFPLLRRAAQRIQDRAGPDKIEHHGRLVEVSRINQDERNGGPLESFQLRGNAVWKSSVISQQRRRVHRFELVLHVRVFERGLY